MLRFPNVTETSAPPVLAAASHLQLQLLSASNPTSFTTISNIDKNHRENQPLGQQSDNMPGAGKQPPQVQDHIKELLEAGFDPTTIHRRLKVGRSSIYRMKRCLQQHGTAYMPVELNKKNGRPKVLTGEQELVCRHSQSSQANEE